MATPNQIGPLAGVQPYTNSQNFGQLIGEISSYVTHCPIPVLQNILNDSVRIYYDRRTWLGLLQKGQIISPGYYSKGTVQLTQGSPTVIGTNTNWTLNLGGTPLIGQSLRVGFTSPIYNVIAASLLTNPQTLTLELPWGNKSVTSTGYYLAQFYYPVRGAKFIYSLKNLQLCYRIWTNVSQALIENYDPSRLQSAFPRIFAQTQPTPAGDWQGELWPVPSYSQAFPMLFYAQPPNLVNDNDQLPAYTRADVIKSLALSEALMYHPKMNPNYSEGMCMTISTQKRKEFEVEVEHAAQNDEALFRNDIVTQWEQFPMAGLEGGNMLSGGAYSAAWSPVTDSWSDY